MEIQMHHVEFELFVEGAIISTNQIISYRSKNCPIESLDNHSIDI